jgi:hypothetical protein
MNFRSKHRPENVNDLVFRDPKVAQIIAEYAAGIRTKPLMLEGPTGSGKSEAGRLIIKERLFETMGPFSESIFHGQGFNKADLKKISGDWNFQRVGGGGAYSMIDEVDYSGAGPCREIQRFIDTRPNGTLICTTNHIEKLSAAFLSRFYVVKVEPPLPADWHPRALQILQSEGHAVNMQTVQTLFANFHGHARDFMDLVEDAHINLCRNQKAQANNSSVTPAASPYQGSVLPGISLSAGLQAKSSVTSDKKKGKSPN